MFSGETILKRLSSTSYILESTLSFETDKLKITIKKGLVTDGASIPQIFWSIIGCPLMGKYVGSALIHDGLYMSEILPRKEADKLFLEMMKDNNVGFIKRNLMYLAVRAGGYFVWKEHQIESVNYNKQFVEVKYV